MHKVLWVEYSIILFEKNMVDFVYNPKEFELYEVSKRK